MGRNQRFSSRRYGWKRSGFGFGSRPVGSEAQQQQQQQQKHQEKVEDVERVSSSKGPYVFPPSAKTLPQPPPDWLIDRESDKNPPVNDSWQIFAIHLK